MSCSISALPNVSRPISWTFGSFGGVTWSQFADFRPGSGWLWSISSHLLVKPAARAAAGETYARSMGLNVRSGPVGSDCCFRLPGRSGDRLLPIGSGCGRAPSLPQPFCTSDHRLLLPAVTLLGGAVALGAGRVGPDARQPVDPAFERRHRLAGRLPVVTWVILRQHNLRESFAG